MKQFKDILRPTSITLTEGKFTEAEFSSAGRSCGKECVLELGHGMHVLEQRISVPNSPPTVYNGRCSSNYGRKSDEPDPVQIRHREQCSCSRGRIEKVTRNEVIGTGTGSAAAE